MTKRDKKKTQKDSSLKEIKSRKTLPRYIFFPSLGNLLVREKGYSQQLTKVSSKSYG